MKNHDLITRLITEANSGKYEIEIADLFADAWQTINSQKNEISELELKLKRARKKTKNLLLILTE